jgi:hypothetical protein
MCAGNFTPNAELGEQLTAQMPAGDFCGSVGPGAAGDGVAAMQMAKFKK